MSTTRDLFIRREYAAIKGKRSLVFWLLYAIVLTSLLAIAVGRAALEHLRQKMEDPFTSLVSIPVLNARHQGSYNAIKGYLDSCATHHAFDAAASSGSYAGGWFIYSRARGEGSFTYAHSFGFWRDSTLLRNILGPGNLLADLSGGRLGVPDTYRDAIIITRSLLDEIGIDTAEARGKRLLILDGAFTIPLRVVAVVRTLPDKSKAYCEHTLLRGIEQKDDEHLMPTDDVSELTIYLDADVADIPAERAGWDRELRASVTEASDIRFEPCTTIATHAVQAVITLNGAIDMYRGPVFYQKRLSDLRSPLGKLTPRIAWDPRFKDPDATRDFGANSDPERPDRFDDLSITFRSLDRITDFQRDIEHSVRVELDLDRIESKKNFATVSRLSEFLIFFLVLFAVLAILLFLYNTLKNHLERIQMNLGTFLAFGIPEKFLLSGYLRILFRLVLRVVALALATLLMAQGGILLLERVGANVPDMLTHVDVIGNWWLHIALVFMLSACFVIFRWQLRKFLARPPGDLIYART
jgi:hypothetical protein